MKEYNKDNDIDNDNDKYQFLLKKSKNDPKIYRKTFPLGYQDKRKKKFYKTRKSKNSKIQVEVVNLLKKKMKNLRKII